MKKDNITTEIFQSDVKEKEINYTLIVLIFLSALTMMISIIQ